MNREELENKFYDYFDGGFLCAEAVSKTIVDKFAENPSDYLVKVASGLCGGIGKTFEDTCGALSGGVIAVGYLFGRMEQGKDISDACKIIVEFRQQFLNAFGSTNCAVILQQLGEQENKSKCKQLCAKTTIILSEILERTQIQENK